MYRTPPPRRLMVVSRRQRGSTGIALDAHRWGLIPGYLILSALNGYGLATWRRPADSSHLTTLTLAARGMEKSTGPATRRTP